MYYICVVKINQLVNAINNPTTMSNKTNLINQPATNDMFKINDNAWDHYGINVNIMHILPLLDAIKMCDTLNAKINWKPTHWQECYDEGAVSIDDTDMCYVAKVNGYRHQDDGDYIEEYPDYPRGSYMIYPVIEEIYWGLFTDDGDNEVF